MLKTTDMIIAIGASPGGTEALRVILKVLPPDTLSIIITQPMPERFTKHFADRLNQEFESKKPKRGDSAIPGQAIIAPGSDQLRRSGAQWHVHINQVPPVNRHRPSMNVMFRSVAHSAGSHSLGVLLTVMGNDGAAGLLEMKQAGAFTIAQDEDSCVVFGMPKEAIKAGGVDKILPLDEIPSVMLERISRT